MARPVDVLEQIAKSDDAIFAFDANDLVILWNKGCERLLGRAAYEVLGRHCYDIMCGRDAFGNLYCCPSCPITVQARTRKDDPVQRFELDVASKLATANRRLQNRPRTARYRGSDDNHAVRAIRRRCY